MSYELRFLKVAKKEWDTLDASVQRQLKRKLAERLEAPHVPAARLRGARNRYKIKLRASGYRLVYEVRESDVVVLVVAVGKRDRGAVYRTASARD
ncbi:type II toxin-antitoxin system RelE family toxin [Roseivivax sp.]